LRGQHFLGVKILGGQHFWRVKQILKSKNFEVRSKNLVDKKILLKKCWGVKNVGVQKFWGSTFLGVQNLGRSATYSEKFPLVLMVSGMHRPGNEDPQ
jgi:hypothetical protein